MTWRSSTSSPSASARRCRSSATSCNTYKLDMKPIDVEYLFAGDKVVFYFVAEERVDFRDLVKDLASRFKARIDMRQVGVRDEARMIGGLGHCGEQLCCVRFGGEFQPVSIRMAKEQDLPLNPLKISGLCGRLMCCLRYEFEAYKDYKQRAPKKGAIVETPLGLAKVSELNTPHETVGMRLEDGMRFSVPLEGMECCKGADLSLLGEQGSSRGGRRHGHGARARRTGSGERAVSGDDRSSSQAASSSWRRGREKRRAQAASGGTRRRTCGGRRGPGA